MLLWEYAENIQIYEMVCEYESNVWQLGETGNRNAEIDRVCG